MAPVPRFCPRCCVRAVRLGHPSLSGGSYAGRYAGRYADGPGPRGGVQGRVTEQGDDDAHPLGGAVRPGRIPVGADQCDRRPGRWAPASRRWRSRAQCPRLHRLTNATCAASHKGAAANGEPLGAGGEAVGAGGEPEMPPGRHGAGPARMGFAWPGPACHRHSYDASQCAGGSLYPYQFVYPHHFADRRWLRARHRRCPPTCQAAAAPDRAGGAAADAGCRPRSRPTTDGRAGVPPAPPASRRRWARRALRGRQAFLSHQASQASRPGETPCPLSATIRSLSVNAYAEEIRMYSLAGTASPGNAAATPVFPRKSRAQGEFSARAY